MDHYKNALDTLDTTKKSIQVHTLSKKTLLPLKNLITKRRDYPYYD